MEWRNNATAIAVRETERQSGEVRQKSTQKFLLYFLVYEIVGCCTVHRVQWHDRIELNAGCYTKARTAGSISLWGWGSSVTCSVVGQIFLFGHTHSL